MHWTKEENIVKQIHFVSLWVVLFSKDLHYYWWFDQWMSFLVKIIKVKKLERWSMATSKHWRVCINLYPDNYLLGIIWWMKKKTVEARNDTRKLCHVGFVIFVINILEGFFYIWLDFYWRFGNSYGCISCKVRNIRNPLIDFLQLWLKVAGLLQCGNDDFVIISLRELILMVIGLWTV